MPELPEVEIIIRDLKKFLPGLKITGFWSDLPRLTRVKAGIKKIVGKKILKVERRGKNILINLSGDTTLLVHQKMTGHLMYGKWKLEVGGWKSILPGPMRDDPQNRFIHLILFLSNGRQLALCDMRKFAKAMVWPTSKLSELKDIKLGPDPMDKNFDFKKFKNALAGKKLKIKQALMDQKVIAGIGNIYSDEILWLAGVHPFKKTDKLTQQNLQKIYGAIKPVLKRALAARGSSYIDYRDALGKKGKYQNMQYAYGMEGEKCKKNDGGVIKRMKMGGRSAHFCPVHQKL